MTLQTKRCAHGCGSTLTHRRDCPKFKPPTIAQRTTGLRRTVSTRQRKPIKPVSDKRKVQNVRWRDFRKGLIVERPTCEWPVPHQCAGPIDCHHIWTLGQGGPRVDADNIAVLCRLQHWFAHDHPLEAAELGMLGSAAYEQRKQA